VVYTANYICNVAKGADALKLNRCLVKNHWSLTTILGYGMTLKDIKRLGSEDKRFTEIVKILIRIITDGKHYNSMLPDTNLNIRGVSVITNNKAIWLQYGYGGYKTCIKVGPIDKVSKAQFTMAVITARLNIDLYLTDCDVSEYVRGSGLYLDLSKVPADRLKSAYLKYIGDIDYTAFDNIYNLPTQVELDI